MRRSGLIRVRWPIFGCLFGMAILGYVQRTGVAIAAQRMLPDLGLTTIELGWLLNAFLISYTFLQLPGALLGQRLGPRLTLALIGLVTAASACTLAAVPAGHAGPLVLGAMIVSRFLLGIAQASLFPVATGAIENWFPIAGWGLAQGLIVTGLWVGAAATPPLVAWLMERSGWRFALIASSLPSLILVVLWYAFGRDRPTEHPWVGPAELAEVADNPAQRTTRVGLTELRQLLCHRSLLLLTLAYFFMNYVFYLVTFWAFLYLVEGRGFAILEGGVLASLPFIAAALAAGIGGQVCDVLCRRYGARAMRTLPAVTLPAAAGFLALTGWVISPYAAVAMLCLAFGCTELNEGPFWSAAMRMAPGRGMAATALLNTGGNLGGVAATPVIAALSTGHRWMTIFALGAVSALASAALWMFVDPSQSTEKSETMAELPTGSRT